MAKEKIEHLEERLKIYEEANKELKRDFLLSRLRGAEDEAAVSEKPGPSQSTGQLILSPSSSPEPFASSDGPSNSEEGEEKMKTKKKKKRAKKSKETEACSRSRMTTSEGVIGRYMKVLKHYAKVGSMKRAFDMEHVDRNTIARTAPIAELAIVFPEDYAKVIEAGVDEKETLATFSERCRGAITPAMAAAISTKKKANELLPIVYKLT